MAEISCGALPGAPSEQEEFGANAEGVKSILTLPSVTGGTSLMSVIVNVSMPGLIFLELTVKVIFPFESVAPVKSLAPIVPPLITSPESLLVLVKVIRSPANKFFKLSRTVTEIVAVVDPSAGIEVELTEMLELTISALLLAKTAIGEKTKEKKAKTIPINKLVDNASLLLPITDGNNAIFCQTI